ncbi:MAG: hypothetical protein AMXMBFR4_27740 [Candidatus Hydrogenedentota bacterium]
MARRRHSIVSGILAAVSIAFARVMSVLPLPVCRVIGKRLGVLAYVLVPRVRRVAMDNLRQAYRGEKSERELRSIARGAAINVGIVAAEFSHIPRLDAAGIERLVRVVGVEHLDSSRGGFIIGAHLGNWEWMATVVNHLGFKAAEVVRPLDAPSLNEFVDRVRCWHGVRTLPKEGSGQELMRLLKEGWKVGVLADQSPRESAVPVTFFGRPCWATVAPAMVALRMKMPIHVVTMTRDGSGLYTLEFSPPIELPRTGNLRRDLISITQRCQDLIEEKVRLFPDQWLWLHRRWKARPRLDEEWKAREARD